MDRDQISKIIDDSINEFLINRGYLKSAEGSYHRAFGDLKIIISFGINTTSDIKGDFIIGYGFGIRLNSIEEKWEKYRDNLGESNQPLSDTMGFGRSSINPKSNKYPDHKFAKSGGEFVKKKDDILKYTSEFMDEHDNLLHSFIQKVTNLNWIDNQLNQNPLWFQELCPPFTLSGLEYRKIIAAKLANNPNFENIYRIIREDTIELAKSDEYMKKVLIVLDKVYNDLKEL